MTSEFIVKNYFDFAEEVANYDHNLYMAGLDVESWLALILSGYLPTSLWKKLLRTVSTIYSPINVLVVN